ncbi:hypothetical protein PRZ48_014460 [Zasmidium cellare]|uniref:RRM domain-containing protein n=1 Tax=Zasmidium cellare TaxID=395010 RepID=A0ABR0DYD4_ZASCE|nr:hypothetical protein PRZ48_014460 [Zasmidium cellare]
MTAYCSTTHTLLFGGKPQHRQTAADRGYKNMASMDSKNTNYNRQPAGGYNAGNNMYGNQQYASRGQQQQAYGMHQNPNPDPMATLAHGFQGMNMGSNPSFAAQAKNATMMNNAAGPYNGMQVATTMPGSMYNAGQYVFPSAYGAGNTQSPGMYTPHGTHYMPQLNYGGYQQHDNSPMSQNWTPTTAGATGEVPTLVTPRRDSVSSNENDQPTTPSYAGYPGFAHGGVTINRTPSGVFTHSTPSPTSMMGPYGMALTKQPEQSEVNPRIKLLLSKEPAIPRAIPAPSSPLKPLDRALENQRGETNVYIRGLLPETTDEMLESWGTRFGDIKSSKSIIDLNTGLCKGFGFVKYHNYEDAENCIRGFHYLGYEVSFARESFYSKLKTFSDETNTNLYVSNLPKSMNEHELAQLFAPHKVCSSRILRDKNGHGRGVGFARFDSREACEEVIKTFNNHTINSQGEELSIAIRYADTQEQKQLKQTTQAARQFRSQEYEYACAWREGNKGRLPYPGAAHGQNAGNEFDSYLGTAPAPITAQRWAQSKVPGRSPLSSLPYAAASVNATAGAEQASSSGEAVDSKAATTTESTTTSE